MDTYITFENSNMKLSTTIKYFVCTKSIPQQRTKSSNIQHDKINTLSLDELIGIKEIDNGYMKEATMRAIVENELNQRKSLKTRVNSMRMLCKPKVMKRAYNSDILLAPNRPTNPQCRDPLFDQESTVTELAQSFCNEISQSR